MRKIKFRAWDKKNKRMVNLRSMDFRTNLEDEWVESLNTWYLNREDEFTDYTLVKEDFELMQFTGLKDKNGKEIYEGDILGFTDKRLKQDLTIVNLGIHYCEEYGDLFGYEIYNKKEVLGNIYENPELIKEEK